MASGLAVAAKQKASRDAKQMKELDSFIIGLDWVFLEISRLSS